MIATNGFLTAWECIKFLFCRGSVPDSTGELTALPDLAGLRSPTSKGRIRGGKGERWRRRGEKGKENTGPRSQIPESDPVEMLDVHSKGLLPCTNHVGLQSDVDRVTTENRRDIDMSVYRPPPVVQGRIIHEQRKQTNLLGLLSWCNASASQWKSSSSSSHSQRGPSRRSSMMTASKGLSPEVGRCLAGVASDLVDPSATWATGPTTPGVMGKTTDWEIDVRL